jgi:acetyl esterase/lipase
VQRNVSALHSERECEMRTTRTLPICALALIAAAGVFAVRTAEALPAVQSLYSRIVADRGVTVETGVAYGPLARHVLDIYRPAPGNGAEDGPVVVFIYGGGWRSGERATYGFVGAALAARGITTVIPDYRLYPEVKFPAFVDDAARAYAWVAAGLARSGGKRRPIFLVGHSAGAHTAALLALDARRLADAGVGSEDRPAGLIGLAGPYAFDPTTYPTTKEIFAPALGSQDARPAAFAGAGAPPALLMHGLEDQTVQLSNMRTLGSALQSAGVPVRALELEGIGHTGLVLAISRPFRWRAPVLAEIEAFVRSVTRDGRAGGPPA